MDTGAILFMTITWVIVISLNIFCFTRVLLSGKKKVPDEPGT